MKYFTLLIFSCLSSQALAKTEIIVSCTCNYAAEYLLQTAMVSGIQQNATPEDVASCKIEKGRVLEGCDLAKLNAQWNCQQKSKRMNPDEIKASGYINSESCFGAIEDVK